MAFDLWLAFLAASTALLLIPGPTVLLVLSYALSRGRPVALASAAGVALGDLVAMTASLAGFGRAIGEVGAIMIVGGNIDHATRVLTTAIALETGKGEFEMALALGFVLIGLAIAVNLALHFLSRTERGARW